MPTSLRFSSSSSSSYTERVSVLFKNHPDLLRDFTYFLPDAVQESVSRLVTLPHTTASPIESHA